MVSIGRETTLDTFEDRLRLTIESRDMPTLRTTLTGVGWIGCRHRQPHPLRFELDHRSQLMECLALQPAAYHAVCKRRLLERRANTRSKFVHNELSVQIIAPLCPGAERRTLRMRLSALGGQGQYGHHMAGKRPGRRNS